MAIKFQLKYLNLDSTSDINERLVKFIDPGVVSGGIISVVPSQLKISVSPWKVFSSSGMIVEETSDSYALDVLPGQTNVIALKAIYSANNSPVVLMEVFEKGVFDTVPNRSDYIVFGEVAVPLTASEVLVEYISLLNRQEINPLTRKNYRATVTSISALPSRNNRIGDMYGVCDGVGGPLNLYGWNGTAWTALTDVIALQVDVTRHRQNLFADEKHLTDIEKFAVAGTYGTPSDVNKFVTDTDPRVPTQDENDALTGSAGAPSSTNKYITEATEFAQPTYTNYIVSSPITSFAVTSVQGPVYLGRGGANSHLVYFEIFNESLEREYLNADSSAPKLIGIYKDAALTQKIIDPSSEATTVISTNGFYISGDLYLEFDQAIGSNFRLIYGKKTTLGSFKKDMLMDIRPKEAQIHRDIILKFEEVTGRKFDSIVPSKETNIELALEVGDIKRYINSNLVTDFVVTDFVKMSSIPEYAGSFEENIGLKSYKYLNNPIVPYTYNSTTGIVTYLGTVDLSAVSANHVFIDSNNKEYVIASLTANTLTLSGVPKNVGVNPTNKDHGSIKIDDNPRRINLAEFKVSQFRERIPVSKVKAIPNESYGSALAYGIVDPIRTNSRKENRVRLYGNIQQRSLENFITGPNSGPKNQVYSSDYCVITVTDFFTDLEFVGTIPQAYLSAMTVKLDGFSYPVSLAVDSTLGSTYQDARLVNYPIITNTTDALHTVTITFPVTNTIDELIIGGFDLIRRNYESAFVAPGRGFVQGDLIASDAKQILSLSPLQPLSRGGLANIYYGRDLLLKNDFKQMTEFDGLVSAASGSASSGSSTLLVTSGTAKLQYFNEGDIVKVVTSTKEETKLISAPIASNTITFSSALNITGAANIIHLCSTSSSAKSFDNETETRRIMAENFGLATKAEFGQLPSLSITRSTNSEDGVTRFVTNQLIPTMTGIEGYKYALKFSAASTLRINGCFSSVHLLISTQSAQTINYTINDSPLISKTVSGNGLQKLPLAVNGRFQTYEIEIKNSANLLVVGIVFSEPSHPNRIEGLELSETKYIARYQATNNDYNNKITGKNYPIGAVGFDAFSSFVRFIDGIGTAWASSIDFTKLYGRYNRTNSANASFQYQIFDQSLEFEYTATPDGGYALVTLNGTIAKSSNFAAVYRGIDPATGYVDMYSAVPERRRVVISSLPYNKYTVSVSVLSPFTKNPLSSDYFINVNQVFFTNSNGYFGYANQLAKSSNFYLGYSNTYDRRSFDNPNTIDVMVEAISSIFNLDPQEDVTIIDGGNFV